MSNTKAPSMVALLGLLAVAGYQNRDKISEMIRAKNADADMNKDGAAGQGLLGEIGALFGGAQGGASLSDAVTSLMDRFRGSGRGNEADSWVSPGANRDIAPNDLAESLGEDVLQELAAKTGLSRSDILERLARDLPQAIDRLTPEGRVPSAAEAQAHI